MFQAITTGLASATVILLANTLFSLAIGAADEETDQERVNAAKREYEQAVPPDNEKARLAFVTKLAQIADRLVSDYRRGQRHDELMGAINSELQKNPAPKDVDSKKLRQLLVGNGKSLGAVFSFALH